MPVVTPAAPTGFKSVITTGTGGSGNGIEFDGKGINAILKKSDEYFGWTVHSFNDQEVMLTRQDAGSGGQSFLPLKRADIQRLYDAQKKPTMTIKG